ncbi:MAG: hypothetical protein NVSMB42_15970 [Herpetosiphon sp.]
MNGVGHDIHEATLEQLVVTHGYNWNVGGDRDAHVDDMEVYMDPLLVDGVALDLPDKGITGATGHAKLDQRIFAGLLINLGEKMGVRHKVL